MEALPSALESASLPPFASVECTSILKTAAEEAPLQVAMEVQKLPPLPPRTSRIWLHFGVAAGRPRVNLECCAVNDATFGIPDEAGAQPVGQCVVPGEEHGQCRAPALPVQKLAAAMIAQGHAVAVSEDAGRFLCNFIFYHSLSRCAGQAGCGEETAMFVHVPSASTLPLAKLLELTLDLLRCTAQHVSEAHGLSSFQAAPPTAADSTPATDALDAAAPLLEDLVAMGFPVAHARRALHAVHSASVDAALEWLMAHEEEGTGVPEPAMPSPPDLSGAMQAQTGDVAAAGASAQSSLAAAAGSAPAGLPADLSALVSSWSFDLKLVLLVDASLGMGVGKVAAQCAHAALAAAGGADTLTVAQWQGAGEKVVVLSVPGREQMDQLSAKARAVGLPVHAIRDAGRTEVAPGSQTVVAIGPAFASALDPVTGHLRTL